MFAPANQTQAIITAEIGSVRYEAICHFLIDGDYKADHLEDYAGAFADYAKAWSMLVTAEARRQSGPGILQAMEEFAARSGEPNLVEEANRLFAAYRQEATGL